MEDAARMQWNGISYVHHNTIDYVGLGRPVQSSPGQLRIPFWHCAYVCLTSTAQHSIVLSRVTGQVGRRLRTRNRDVLIFADLSLVSRYKCSNIARALFRRTIRSYTNGTESCPDVLTLVGRSRNIIVEEVLVAHPLGVDPGILENLAYDRLDWCWVNIARAVGVTVNVLGQACFV